MRDQLQILIALLAYWALHEATNAADGEPSFQHVVRPILAEHCFRCHGFDEKARKSGLRLDQFEGATRAAESGAKAIVPGQPAMSELIRRVASGNPDVRMPPPESGKTLSASQIETLQQWIACGARYTKHWAFERPSRHQRLQRESFNGDLHNRPRNIIDDFVLERLQQIGTHSLAASDPARLLRRVSLDLTGLPPTLTELDHFLEESARDAEGAYAAEVERLLSSPHFGERLAIDWLDAARFADTNGFFGDKPRQTWPWRDWVINAFNSNMPFDQFTVEQLAGDLLPDATRDQRIATGFHRNSMANNETGIIDEEYRVEAVADRVDTTATVWMGLTIGCAQCHDHKYDPISQREYYQLFAYFNQSVETGLITKDDPPPTLEVPTPDQVETLRRTRKERETAEQVFQAQSNSLDADVGAWEMAAPKELMEIPENAVLYYGFDPVMTGATILGTTLQRERGIRGDAGKFDGSQHVELNSAFDADRPWTISAWLRPAGSLSCVWSKIEPTDQRRGIELIWQKGRLQLQLVHRWGVDEIAATTREPMSANEWHHVLVSYDGTRKAKGLSVIADGREVPLNVQRDTLTGTLQCREPFRVGRRDSGLGFYGLLDEFRVLSRVVTAEESAGWSDSERLRGILARPMERTANENLVLREYFIAHHSTAELRQSHERLQHAHRAETVARMAIPTALVMQDTAQPRKTHLLLRGQYDKLGDEVRPGVPAVLSRNATTVAESVAELARVQSEGQTPKPDDIGDGVPDVVPNRLAFARWLVSPDNPLTARVAVNRLWATCFGEGLVRTPNDFGTQGELPTHPELLDELAVRFVESGWDVKAMLRLIVTSATYRQSSQASEKQLQADPDNRLLARGPRFRLPAELIRDQALFVSGLFVSRIGGPSVKPFQPDGLWEEVTYNAEDSYVPDHGEGLWRRSLYTYWKRQVPPPALLTFDANTREKCVVRRSRTNTPLQALVLLNDETYVAAARALAELTLSERGDNDSRLRTMFRRVTSRWPEPSELNVLANLLARQRQAASGSRTREGSDQSLTTSATENTADQFLSLNRRELAVWTQVAQTILNLDEVITRR